MSISPIIAELRRIRKEQNLTQVALGAAMDGFTNSIPKWENGYSEPTISHVEAWADALGYELDLFKKESTDDDQA